MSVVRVTRRQRDAAAEAALLGAPAAPPRSILRAVTEVRTLQIPIHRIVPNPQQHRREISEAGVLELSETIRRHGQLEAIRVDFVGENSPYILVYGERRWRAFQWLTRQPADDGFDPRSFELIRADVHQVVADTATRTRRVHALIENICREDPPARDIAAALQALRDETRWSWNDIAEYIGLPLRRVQKLALLHGQDAIFDAVDEHQITQDQGLALALLRDEELVKGLLPSVAGLPLGPTKEIVSAARDLATRDPDARAEDIAQTALASVIDAAPAVGGAIRRHIDAAAASAPRRRPRPASVPFSSDNRADEVSVQTRALETTRLSHFPAVTPEEWITALERDLTSYRDLCAHHNEGGALWSQVQERLLPLLAAP